MNMSAKRMIFLVISVSPVQVGLASQAHRIMSCAEFKREFDGLIEQCHKALLRQYELANGKNNPGGLDILSYRDEWQRVTGLIKDLQSSIKHLELRRHLELHELLAEAKVRQ